MDLQYETRILSPMAFAFVSVLIKEPYEMPIQCICKGARTFTLNAHCICKRSKGPSCKMTTLFIKEQQSIVQNDHIVHKGTTELHAK